MKNLVFASIWLTLVIAPGACFSLHAQEPDANGLKPLATLLEIEKVYPVRLGLSHPGVSLDLAGTQLLVTLPLLPTASIFDVDSGSEEIVRVDNRLLYAWIDSETGAVFMQKLVRDYNDESLISGKYLEENTELHYFRSLDDFRRGDAEWVSTEFNIRLFSIRYIPSFGIFVCSFSDSSKSVADKVAILDQSGRKVGGFDLPGDMFAVDTKDGVFEVFFRRPVRSKGRKREGELCSAPIRSDLGGVGKLTPMYPIGSGFPMGWNGRFMSDTRFFRLRGLKEGDISKFFYEVYPRPGYWSFEDLHPIRDKLDEALAPVTLDMLIGHTKRHAFHEKDGFQLRLHSLNQLEAFEDPYAYEFASILSITRQILFFNRQGEGGLFSPPMYGHFDGVINEERKIVVFSSTTPWLDRERPAKLTVKVVKLE